MANLLLKSLKKAFGDAVIIPGVDLEIRDGEFIVFVGPSGCGKSTVLRCIAGLEDITSGELYIGGELVNEVPPAKRGIAMVFQSYALYPHMTVAENMAFGLKLAGYTKEQMKAAVDRALAGHKAQCIKLIERVAKPKIEPVIDVDKVNLGDVRAGERRLDSFAVRGSKPSHERVRTHRASSPASPISEKAAS